LHRPKLYTRSVYQSLLTRRYLTTKIMPLLASLGVALSTAMVLITWSVMGGFLNSLSESGRSLIGDVRIAWPNTGFPYYQDLIDRLEAHPEVKAASPVIDSFGAIRLPDGRTEGVQIRGIDGPSFAQVTTFGDTLWWKAIDTPMPRDKERLDPRLSDRAMGNAPPTWPDLEYNGLTLSRPDAVTGEREAGIVLGIGVTMFNRRENGGYYSPLMIPEQAADGSVSYLDQFLPIDGKLVLRVFPLDSQGRPRDSVARLMPVANEFESGLFDIDRSNVLIRLDALQSMLAMGEGRRMVKGFDALVDDPSQSTIVDPARVTTVLVRHRDDKGDVDELAELCRLVYAEFAAAHPGEVPAAEIMIIETWEQANATMIAAVQKETMLVLFIFTFISMTAVFLVVSIFWSMISEKTRDIGVLRAIGASRSGIAWIWLIYGSAIGVIGAILGGTLAYAIVSNINAIHDWMGESLGLYIWDPSVYVFKRIPDEIDPVHAAYVLTGGVLSCLIGALVPAVRAAWMDPVKALRFE